MKSLFPFKGRDRAVESQRSLDIRAVQNQPISPNSVAKAPRIRGATAVPSVCPYCAVGCGQVVYVKGGQIIDIEGFQGSGTASRYLNLLITYLRFKPLTDCRKKNKHQSGKNRLQLAGVDTRGLDWVRFSQKKRGQNINS